MIFVLRRLLLLLAGLLGLMSLTRIAFYFAHGEAEQRAAEAADWAAAALLGARFDLLVLAYLALPALLILLVAALRSRPGGPARWLLFARQWFFWGFLLLALIALVDFCFYGFYQDRLNVLVFGFFEDHTTAVLGMIWDLYPVPAIALGAGVGVWAAWAGSRRVLAAARAPEAWGASRARAAGLALLLLLAAGAAARGSLGKFPLRARMASVSPHAFVNLCVLNGPFALKEAISARLEEDASPLAPRLGFADPAAAFAVLAGADAPAAMDAAAALDLLRERAPTPPPRPGSGSPAGAAPHVVVVLMESLGSHLLRHHGPGFDLLGSFAPHAAEGLWFPRALPEANGTIGTVTALATGLPNRPRTTYLSQSRWADVAVPTAPAGFFAAAGYDTVFVYGGHASWRKIDQFLPRQGFARVEGLPAIHAALGLGDADQAFWKTFDEHTFRRVREILRAATRPTYVVVLTATNHPPFEWMARFELPPLTPPPELLPQLREGALAGRLRGVQYSLGALGGFLDGLATDGTLEQSIVAVTGDHNTFDYAAYEAEDLYDRWGVPVWLHVPAPWRPAQAPDLQAPLGHLDLIATLMHLALPDGGWLGFGASVYDPARVPRVFHQEEQESIVLDDDFALQEGALGTRAWRAATPDSLRLERVPEGPRHAALRRWGNARLAAADHLLRWLKP